jgi:hypothetical protein
MSNEQIQDTGVAGKPARPQSKRKRLGAAYIDPPPPALPGEVYTVREFCTAFRISRSFYHKLKRSGLGQQETKIGERVLIGRAAADRWFAERQAAGFTAVSET